MYTHTADRGRSLRPLPIRRNYRDAEPAWQGPGSRTLGFLAAVALLALLGWGLRGPIHAYENAVAHVAAAVSLPDEG